MQEQELYDRQVNRMAKIYRCSRVGTLIAAALSVAAAAAAFLLGAALWVSLVMLVCGLGVWFFSRRHLKFWDPSEYKNNSPKDLKTRGNLMMIIFGILLIAGGDLVLVALWFWKIIPDIGVCLGYMGVMCLGGAVPVFFIMKGYFKDANVSGAMQLDVDFLSLTMKIPGVLTFRSRHSNENTQLFTAREGKKIEKMFYISLHDCEEGVAPQKQLSMLADDFAAAREWKNMAAADEYCCAGMTARSYKFRYSDTGGKAWLLMIPRPEAVYCLIFYRFSKKEFKRTVASIKLKQA